MSIKQVIKKHPALKTAAQAIRGDQLIALNYPVDLKPRYGGGPHPGLLEMLTKQQESYARQLQSFLRFTDELSRLDVRWRNGYFPALDATTLYSLLVQNNPKTYLEIGSGNSTIFARHAVGRNELRTKVISIDPASRAEIDGLCDQVIRERMENVSLDAFDQLDPGDILFVDNSHRVLPNSDATVFFVDILPRLNRGVLIHLHDITLPWDYPLEVARDAYSEQYPLASLLLLCPNIQTILPNHFVSRTPKLISILNPLFDRLGDVEREGVSFWFTITLGI